MPLNEFTETEIEKVADVVLDQHASELSKLGAPVHSWSIRKPNVA